MASDLGKTILVTLDDDPVDDRPILTRIAAFVPITIALIGVGAVLLGGLSATSVSMAERTVVDPIATGSIAGD
ncbi:MAG: hypothetical protein GY798_31955 [Hyphomicrobiales bacterium]|nr:hypothetical protein [Hyphomicrobiales bacterium]